MYGINSSTLYHYPHSMTGYGYPHHPVSSMYGGSALGYVNPWKSSSSGISAADEFLDTRKLSSSSLSNDKLLYGHSTVGNDYLKETQRYLNTRDSLYGAADGQMGVGLGTCGDGFLSAGHVGQDEHRASPENDKSSSTGKL